MYIDISEQAADWYKNELELTESQALRFFVRYGGSGGVQPGFSLGVKVDNPINPVAKKTVNGILFFIEADDEWYFDNRNLVISIDKFLEEPSFDYPEN